MAETGHDWERDSDRVDICARCGVARVCHSPRWTYEFKVTDELSIVTTREPPCEALRAVVAHYIRGVS